MHKLLYVGGHYIALILVLASCWGYGRSALRLVLAQRAPEDAGLTTPISITLGLGVAICLLQWLGIAGMLTQWAVGALLLLGMVLAFTQWIIIRRDAVHSDATWKARWLSLSPWARCTLLLALLALVETLLTPLRPPLKWDELMYHLPHAQQWASSGRLDVTTWLRYPWFPYNYDLLYAASLVLGSDVFTHLLHATSGWLTAWLILAVGTRYLGVARAGLATIIWLLLTRKEYDGAINDMGVTLFVFAACVTFQQWREHGSRGWLAISAFMLGLALGTKYQALPLIGLFGLAVLWRTRRIADLAVASIALAVPCAYWYGRNWILTGDPFAPIGGHIFGFSDWNAGDYKGQFEDLAQYVGLPPRILWAAPLALLARSVHREALRGAIIFALFFLAAWAASSRFARYLMPAFPVLALLAASGWAELARLVVGQRDIDKHLLVRWILRLLPIAMAVAVVVELKRDAARIAPDPAARDAIAGRELAGYRLLRDLSQSAPGKIYQIGLEYAIYYAPHPIWGDWFGPWRYRDYLDLAPDALRNKLAHEGFQLLLVNTARFPAVVSKPGFQRYFEEADSDGPVKLYRIKPE
ncbi:MAG: hypothetical protein JSS14_05515 [Proteobacteria bacterium]|nr:hypothetical protein [Pseudomonadota bacterium]